MEIRHHIAVTLLVWALSCVPAAAQYHRLVPLDHWAYEYVQRLQHRGVLLALHPTALPYDHGELRAALARIEEDGLSTHEQRWLRRLKQEFPPPSEQDAFVAGAELQPGLRAATHARIDPLRPLDDKGASLHAFGVNFFPNVAGRLFLEYGPVVAQAGLRFDAYYRDDPDGLDAANRLITRNEDTYVGVGSQYVSAHVGRLRRHWAPYRASALLLSDNPVGFDQIALRIGGRKLVLRSVLGELDSMTPDGRFTGTAGADSIGGSVRRYVAAHRFDWRPTRSFALTLMESTLYSGENTGLSLNFLNPLNIHAFSVDGRPKNEENNGLLAGILWLRAGSWTMQGQLLVDDVDLMGQTAEPASAALSGTIVYAGRPGIEIGGSLTAVSARTYNTHQPEGRYIHLMRGIGTQFSDYVRASLFASVFGIRGDVDVELTPKLDLLLQGERDIRQPYPRRQDQVDLVLHGDVARILRPALDLRLQQSRTWWLHLDAGPAFDNDGSVRFTGTASFSARFALSRCND